MRTYRLIVGTAILLWPAVVVAGITAPPKGPEINWSISLFLGAATYAMDDLNAMIDRANQDYGPRNDPIDHGNEAGGRLAVEIGPRWDIGLTYTAMHANSSYGPLAESGDAAEIDIKGRIFELQARYEIYSGRRVNCRVGAAMGLLRGDGSIKGNENDIDFNFTFEGDLDGPTFAVNAAIEYAVDSAISLWMEGGARSAETGSLTDSGHLGYWINPDGSRMTFSYSGMFIRLGLSISSLIME